MTTTSTHSPAAEDFAEPGVLNLGEFNGRGGLDTAVALVLDIQRDLDAAFGTKAVQFHFNGTPMLVRAGSSATDVLLDWTTRRAAFQAATEQ